MLEALAWTGGAIVAVAVMWLGAGAFKELIERRAFVASLSHDDRERLRGFEMTGGTWRLFRAIEQEAAKGRMYA